MAKWIGYGLLMVGYGMLFVTGDSTSKTSLELLVIAVIVAITYGALLLFPFYLTLRNMRWYNLVPLGMQFAFLALVLGVLNVFWVSGWVYTIALPLAIGVPFLSAITFAMDPYSLNIIAAFVLGIYVTLVGFREVGNG